MTIIKNPKEDARLRICKNVLFCKDKDCVHKKPHKLYYAIYKKDGKIENGSAIPDEINDINGGSTGEFHYGANWMKNKDRVVSCATHMYCPNLHMAYKKPMPHCILAERGKK